MKQIHLYNVKIDNVTLTEAVELALLPRESPCFVVTPNAVMLDACRKQPSFSELLNSATLALPDGTGVLLAARRQGAPLKERVTGIAFGEALLGRAAKEGLRVFLLGGKPGVASRAAQRLCLRYPGLQICGTQHGYFQKSGVENQALLNTLAHDRPDILFVCFGFPDQECWIQESLPHLPFLRVVAGLGGSLDIWSGDLRRAPMLLRSLGLEWAWRMAREPKRLKHLPAIWRMLWKR